MLEWKKLTLNARRWDQQCRSHLWQVLTQYKSHQKKDLMKKKVWWLKKYLLKSALSRRNYYRKPKQSGQIKRKNEEDCWKRQRKANKVQVLQSHLNSQLQFCSRSLGHLKCWREILNILNLSKNQRKLLNNWKRSNNRLFNKNSQKKLRKS